MSVAFRRDSDEEHLEPKFEIPIPPGPNLVTARGLALVRQRVAEFGARLAVLTQHRRHQPPNRAAFWDHRCLIDSNAAG